MKRLIIWAITFFLVGVILSSSIILVAVADGLTKIKVLSQILIFIGNGLGDIFFTPYLLLIALLFVLISKPDLFLKAAGKFSHVFEEIGVFKFRQPAPEEPIAPEKLEETIGTSKAGQPNRKDALFFKELLTRNTSMVICRFLLYAIDRPGRSQNFSLRDIAIWTFGEQATVLMEKHNSLESLALPAGLLIQTGALEGTLTLAKGQYTFEKTTVNPAAHQALEELGREGFQMTPQVKIV